MTDVPTAKWRSVTASAPAKVILHGEHSVVYGKLALAASIDLRTKVIIKLSSCKKRLLRVNLLNYSKKSLDFDLQVNAIYIHSNFLLNSKSKSFSNYFEMNMIIHIYVLVWTNMYWHPQLERQISQFLTEKVMLYTIFTGFSS